MWSANLFQVTSGNIGPRLNFESMSWSIELNGVESISLKLKKSDLPAINLKQWLAPWWAGVVIFWNDTPIAAGPIITAPNETFSSISINCGGIRSVLANRYVVRDQNNWDTLRKDVVQYTGLSLGTIAKRVVDLSMAKPGGALPITFPIADQTVVNDADHQRTYRGFNIQNLNTHDVLTKLSNVINGPDVLFKPRLIRDNQLTFDMWHGTETQPRIYQKQTPVWDTTPATGPVTDISLITTGTYMTNRTYSIGAGQDEGLLMKVNTNEAPLQAQYPLLESVVNVGNSENPVVVNGYGISSLWSNKEPLSEIQMTIRGDGIIPFGEFWPGDMVHVITKGWINLPDGVNRMRLLSLSGNTSSEVKVSLQKEEKFT